MQKDTEAAAAKKATEAAKAKAEKEAIEAENKKKQDEAKRKEDAEKAKAAKKKDEELKGPENIETPLVRLSEILERLRRLEDDTHFEDNSE